ncbi:PEP-CTERM motif protein [Pirellulimonas nuda]|uniref:PEP-CTERM motif protein n=1 Tax=Pirellulimonas nuda TaxID=2528009 RepID=A0A518DCZ6_9BACT|nr:PEP-CTERM sorting domain-containing protein [Pirellulimonas nuda]QDU89323.1 PEP-CTERM motif protein [Pirellulimonas nuda]
MISSPAALSRAARRLLFCAVALGTIAPASAGVITSVTMFGPNAGVGPGLGTVAVPAIITGAPNNDNVPTPGVPDNNVVVPIKRFDANGFIDIEFFVSPSNGVTEYAFFESADNNTGVDWSGYRMILGYGVGPAFVPSGPGDGLDFDFPDYDLPPTSSAFPVVVTPNEDTLLFSGGTQSAGAESFQFRIDVPDVPTSPYFSRFTLRQVPRPAPVPEPASLLLLGVGAAGLGVWRQGASRG